MRKTIFLILIFLAFSFFGCVPVLDDEKKTEQIKEEQNPDLKEGWKRYESKEFGIRFAYPEKEYEILYEVLDHILFMSPHCGINPIDDDPRYTISFDSRADSSCVSFIDIQKAIDEESIEKLLNEKKSILASGGKDTKLEGDTEVINGVKMRIEQYNIEHYAGDNNAGDNNAAFILVDHPSARFKILFDIVFPDNDDYKYFVSTIKFFPPEEEPQISFANCGKPEKYSDHSWFSNLTILISVPYWWREFVSNMCVAEDESMVIAMMGGSVFRYFPEEKRVETAFPPRDQEGLSLAIEGYREFGKQSGNSIPIFGRDDYEGYENEYIFFYDFMQNTLSFQKKCMIPPNLSLEYEQCHKELENLFGIPLPK